MSRTVAAKMGFRPGLATRHWRMLPELAPLFAETLAAEGEPAVWRVGFARDAEAVAAAAQALVADYAAGGWLWICYPKKTGAIRTDISRDHGWAPVTEAGFLGVTQIAVDATWSALRFRKREEIARVTRRSASV